MIAVKNLRMEYGDHVAIENLSLEIGENEVFGLIGPNGAGKTTLIRILATLLEPTYGSLTIQGVDVSAEPLQIHPLIAYMSDFFSLYDAMRVWEYLDHFASCYGVPPIHRQRLIDQALELVSLEVRRDAEIGSLSRGMRQRLCFAKSLLHEPQVLLLDEPASGLDPAGRIEFRELIKQLHAMGRTVLISSHILTEMTEFCTSIGILEQGKLLASGRVGDLLNQMQCGLRLQIEVAGEGRHAIEALAALITASPHAKDVRIESALVGYERLSCDWLGAKAALPQLHREIVEANIPLVGFAVEEDDLEDIYMRISGHRTS